MGMIANYQESADQELDDLKGSADFVDAVEELQETKEILHICPVDGRELEQVGLCGMYGGGCGDHREVKSDRLDTKEVLMEKAIAIDTCLGVLNGRDCVYLNQMKRDGLDTLTFMGDINGHLISRHRDEKRWFPYTLIFQRVLAYFACELDTYENMVGLGHLDGSSFDLIEDSSWLKSLPVREDFDKNIYQHYRLFTYDDVYNIIAVSYKLEVDV